MAKSRTYSGLDYICDFGTFVGDESRRTSEIEVDDRGTMKLFVDSKRVAIRPWKRKFDKALKSGAFHPIGFK